MKISEANKNTVRTPLIWASCMAVVAIIQEVFDLYIGNEIIDNPVYYCSIIWIMFACLIGKFEAFYFAMKMNSKMFIDINEHLLFTCIRGVVLIPIFILTDWKAVLCYVAMFPFFHDGAYYTQRERIKPNTYHKKWFAQSTTSTAKLTKYFTPVVRTSLAIIAIAMIIVLRYKYL